MAVLVRIVALGHSSVNVAADSGKLDDALKAAGFSPVGLAIGVWRAGVKASPPLEDGDIITCVPAGGIRGEATIKAGGRVWRVHLNDPDPFPSDLHAHSRERSETLDLFTGNLYDARTRACIGKIRSRDLEAIWRRLPTKLHPTARGG